MNKKLFAIIIFACCLFTVHRNLLSAADFGLTLDQNAELSGPGTNFNYNGILVPHISGLLGSGGGLYISAALNWENNPWGLVPELLRTDFSWRSEKLEFKMGRMSYFDPLNFIAGGLFDGFRFSFDGTAGTFSFGAWYTGLLYKKRANIGMTSAELMNSISTVDYGNFMKSYFAPRRILSAFDWEHQGLGERVMAKFSILGQFDLSGESLHSQYFAGKLSVPAAFMVFDLGGCFELLEAGADNTTSVFTAFAADLGIAWRSPSHRLSLLGRYSSGGNENKMPFLPLTTISQGYVLQPKLSAISLVSLDYVGRLHRVFSLGLSSYYFIRNFWESNSAYSSKDSFLGCEFSGGLYWSPISDISLNFRGGVFLPSLGNAAPNGKNLWRIDLDLVLLLF